VTFEGQIYLTLCYPEELVEEATATRVLAQMMQILEDL